MNIRKSLALITLATTSVWTSVPADATSVPALRDSLERSMATVTTPADSLPTLYQLYDLAEWKSRGPAAWRIYNTAKRAGDVDEQVEMIKHLSTLYYTNDSVLRVLERELHALPQVNGWRESETYLNLNLAKRRARQITPQERQEILADLVQKYTSGNVQDDVYTQVQELFTLCIFLETDTQGELLTTFFDQLNDKIRQLPHSDTHALASLFYTNAAILYTNNDMRRKAIEADCRQLELIDDIEKYYRSIGRKHRDFDINRYICLRRIMRNSQVLSDEDEQRYYDLLTDIYNRNATVKKDMDYYQRPQIFHLLHEQRYAETIPLIKRVLPMEKEPNLRRQMLRQLIVAADAVGDRQTKLEASAELNEILEKLLTDRSDERFRETQIIYQISNLQAQRDQLELERNRAEVRSHHTIMWVGVVVMVLLGLLVGVFYILFRRMRALSHKLFDSNAQLLVERDTLKRTRDELIAARDKAAGAEQQKSDFINYLSQSVITPLNTITEYSQMIIDCANPEQKSYLDRFAHTVRLNTQLLQTLANDLQEFNMQESTQLGVKIRPVSIHHICELAVANSRAKVRPGVELSFPQEDEQDVTIHTDPYRVEVVLMNLLNNAAKFTHQGSITLSYSLNELHTQVTFAVTDTGVGIPADKEEVIFERFEKAHDVPGTGLGLTISRLVATLLCGKVWVDTDYPGPGARFLFTIPM